MDYSQRIRSLRKKMHEANIDAFIVYSTDPHNSVAVADHWRTVRWLVGFSGWVGSLVITRNKSAFWTDGRYTIQAQRELEGLEIEQYCFFEPNTPTIGEWISSNLEEGSRVGVNGSVLMVNEYRHLMTHIGHKASIELSMDLVGELWEDRPAIPNNMIFNFDIKYSGASRKEKLAQIRKEMKSLGVDYYIASGLDDIAWITNLRGHDSKLYPIFHGYFLISEDEAQLFCCPNKITSGIQSILSSEGIQWENIDNLQSTLSNLITGRVIFLDPSKTNVVLINSLPDGMVIIEGLDLITRCKAKKNAIEIQNISVANIKEGVCIVRLIRRLKDEVEKREIRECDIRNMIEEERLKMPGYICSANIPIVGYGGNAAVLHYRPTEDKYDILRPEGLLLFDLCAHYYEGTTDISRTIALGPLTESMKWAYTFVLKRHIALATQKFPYGCTGPLLDGIIKAPYWNLGIDNPAGTGHGIGYCTYVQEGPCKIAIDASPFFQYMFKERIEPGMVFSNEPGLYDIACYAVRIENTIVAVDKMKTASGRYLGFDTLTYIPFEKEAILINQLSENEIEWIDEYHMETWNRLSPWLNKEEKEWLKMATMPLLMT